MRRTTLTLFAIALVTMTSACGGSGDTASSSSVGSSAAKTVTTFEGASNFPFDATSAAEFPGKSLDQRLQMAQQVCDSIAAHGDDFVAWLTLSTTRSDLVPFAVDQQTLSVFSGLAVKALCPKYIPQLQSALGQASS